MNAATTLDFEDLTPTIAAVPSNTGFYFDGYGFGAPDPGGSWISQGATFVTHQYGPGWSYSNVNNTTTAGFGNQWSAFTGSGFGGSGNYALVNSYGGAYINFSSQSVLSSVKLTNTTYAAISMRDGDSIGKKFGGTAGTDQDFFTATFTGYSGINGLGTITGSRSVYLADFRDDKTGNLDFAVSATDYILATWLDVDLSELGTLNSLDVTFASSDNHPMFGMNTPAYVALDNLTVTAVPEPGSVAVLAIATAIGGWRLRRRMMPKVVAV